MKICPLCQKMLELSYFPQIKGKPYTYCIDCKRIIQRDWIRKKEEKKNLKININI